MTRRRWALIRLLLLGVTPWAMGAMAATQPKPAPKPQPEREVLLQADQVVYDGDNHTVSAVGHVEIVDEGRILEADRVTYDQKTDKVTADGHVSLTDRLGNVAFANSVVLMDHMRDGALSGFGALIGKNGRLAAQSAQRVGGTLVIAHYTNYSACKICNRPGQRTPLWQVKSEKVVYDQVKHRIHFTDASVDFMGVPILYMPYLTESDPTVKYSSGFLMPDVGDATNVGYFVRVPYYISLSPQNDLTLAPQFSTESGELLESEYRQRWENSGMWLQDSIAYNPQGGLGGHAPGPQFYDHLFGSGHFQINDDWNWGFNAELTNNAAYMRFYDISYLDRLVSDLFVEDDTGRSRFALSSYYFQGLRETDVQAFIPYVLPELDYTFIPDSNVAGGRFRFDVNSVTLTRSAGPDSQRLTSEVDWRLPMVFGDGQLWTLIAHARGDVFHVDNHDPVDFPSVPNQSRFVSRGIPYVALDWRWPFVADEGQSTSYVIEPLTQLIAQPYGGNPAGLPLEDVDAFEFDDNNIFSVNQLPGYDLVESGPRANVGAIADMFFNGGELQGLVGQTYRVKPDPIFADFVSENGTTSDIIGRVTLKLPHLNFTDRLDFDRTDGTVRRHEVYFTGSYGRSAIQIAYLQLPEAIPNLLGPDVASNLGLSGNQQLPAAISNQQLLTGMSHQQLLAAIADQQLLTDQTGLELPARQQINAQADINIYENWQAFAAVERDLQAGQMLDSEYGLGYEDECLAISLAYRRKYVGDIALGVPPSTSVLLRFSLKTGDQPVQPFTLFPPDVFNTAHP